ncbi:beta-N-acetylglucosaminidase domain-containing protein [Tessaracoccus sp. MC1756]|uniref:beta-N-acetylglucosaminidase domain-containing protein n=1 Tax=Tessaracoccus sp. MC1756 TaxID=2760311 RepID=UPI001601F1BB|nr:beta-N-acetylglucosaminidase domain-containing protein [Tessaracoccus sp. MC1756]MBB1510396.1 beta-N-acetylglucosaminidase domain-containing protein [Tessaracoccus sp. MC1756]
MRRILALSAAAALLASSVVAAGSGPAMAADPVVLPTPQSIIREGAAVALDGAVTVVAPADVDGPAKRELIEVLTGVDATVTWANEAPTAGTVIHFAETDPTTRAVAAQLGVADASTLNAEGYVVANGTVGGQPTVLLEGASARGLFYAVDTFEQLLQGSTVVPATVRDWPLMSIRGGIEGFYGIPWSHQARLDQLEFYGEHKMNTYIYTPKDDAYLRSQWRTPYPQPELEQLRELVQTGRDNHVEFVFALSPGNDICYSLDSDFDATIAKFEQLRQIGVRTFYIALDDIDPYLKCAQDLQRFTLPGFRKLAEGQAYYLNRVINEFIKPNNLEPLQTVPTNYAGSAPDAYKLEFGTQTDDSLIMQWTGEGVFSDQITMESAARAKTTYNTEHLYIWDNFPVNDGQPDRLFLNPLSGRAADLHQHLDGFTSNPMVQSYASMIALAGYADYTWNGPAYTPAVTQTRILDELAGDDPAVREALEVFVDLNQDWRPYRPSSPQAPALGADIAAFWAAHDAGTAAGTQPLKERLATIAGLEESLAGMAMTGFYDDSLPWIQAATEWATALSEAVVGLEELAADDGSGAAASFLASAAERKKASTTYRVDGLNGLTPVADRYIPKVGDTRFDTFLQEAYGRYLTWLGAEPYASETLPGAPTRSARLGQYQTNAIERIVDGNLSTFWWSSAAPQTGDWVQMDLGSVQAVGGVSVHQADSDGSRGDMFYNAALEYSTDGATWTTAGEFTDAVVLAASFQEPVQARYVRVRATAPNAGGQWIKIREFRVLPPSAELVSTAPDGNPVAAVDANLTTALEGTAEAGQYLSRWLDAPLQNAQIRVVGAELSGTVEALVDGAWEVVGEATAPWFEGVVGGEVTAVRIVFDAGPVSVTELLVSPYDGVIPSPSPSAKPSVSPSAKPTNSPTPPSKSPSAKPTVTPSTPGRFEPKPPYTAPGIFELNGRQWMTTCEPYSQTQRCRTEIWATIVRVRGGEFVRENAWAFNNLTYLPYMTRAAWKGNPLGDAGVTDDGVFTSGGRQWRTECDTAATGRGACRSYTWTTVYAATAKPGGGYAFSQSNQWVFNNIVMFRTGSESTAGDSDGPKLYSSGS